MSQQPIAAATATLSPTSISEMGLFHPPAMRTVAPGAELDPPDALARAIEVADHERNAVARAGGDAARSWTAPAYGWERQPRTTIAGMPASITQPVSCRRRVYRCG
ncbi:hypothetical protein [Streptomyces goshikiensis]|uniref:hypothetical protein n=1 Tax=Streptomyces goshikiensis TaxID=1942 RepID=UPI0036A355B7